MNTGEWSCLISFALSLLSCSERGGSEKFKIKIYDFSGIRTQARHFATGKSAVKTTRSRRLDEDLWFNVLKDSGIHIDKRAASSEKGAYGYFKNFCEVYFGFRLL